MMKASACSNSCAGPTALPTLRRPSSPPLPGEQRPSRSIQHTPQYALPSIGDDVQGVNSAHIATSTLAELPPQRIIAPQLPRSADEAWPGSGSADPEPLLGDPAVGIKVKRKHRNATRPCLQEQVRHALMSRGDHHRDRAR